MNQSRKTLGTGSYGKSRGQVKDPQDDASDVQKGATEAANKPPKKIRTRREYGDRR